jgi:hypothetical protein
LEIFSEKWENHKIWEKNGRMGFRVYGIEQILVKLASLSRKYKEF